MALRPCKECGQQISIDAKACPHCGKKQANSRAAVGCLTLVALLIVLGIVGSLNRDRVEAPTPRPATHVEQQSQATAPEESALAQPKHAMG